MGGHELCHHPTECSGRRSAQLHLLLTWYKVATGQTGQLNGGFPALDVGPPLLDVN